MIKNATIYSVTMPNRDDFDEMITDEFVSKYPHKTQHSTVGFSEIYPEVMVREIPELGYSFNVTIWEKPIKPKVVNRLVNERLAVRDVVTKQEREEIREHVLAELIERTEAESKVIPCYYNEKEKLMFVDNTSNKVTDLVTHILVQAVKSLKTTTIHLSSDNGLTKAVRDYFNEGIDVLSGFQLDGNLKFMNDEKSTLELKGWNFDINSMENEDIAVIVNSIDHDRHNVKSIGFSGDHIQFTLTDEFKLKSIKYPSYELPEWAEDDLDVWQHEVSSDLLLISSVVKTMVSKWSLPEETTNE